MTQFTKIIYILLFVLIVLTPHFGIGHLFSIPELYAQSLTTLVLFGVAYIVYLLHRRDLRKTEKEKQTLENKFLFSSEKLNDAYRYIGSVNRRISLLNDMSTGLLGRTKETKKGKLAIFQELLMTAVMTLSHSSWGMFRFIQVVNGRTEKEFTYAAEKYILLKSNIGNRELLRIRRTSDRIAKIGNLHVVPTSDREASVQCFFIFAKGEYNIEVEISALQAIVDQAQLFYKYFSETPKDSR